MSSVWNSQAWAVVDPDGKGEGDPVDSPERIQWSVEFEPGEPACRDTLAWALFAKGRRDETLAESQKAPELVSEDEKEACPGSLERLRSSIVERQAMADEQD
jgi:hypothetical protein